MPNEQHEKSIDEVVLAVGSLPGVRKFEYQPEKKFLHVTGEREFLQPFDVVQKIEELGIPTDGLFVYYPPSTGADYAQHIRYNALMKAFGHSTGHEVDAVKN